MPKGIYKRTKPVWNKGLTTKTDKRVALLGLKSGKTRKGMSYDKKGKKRPYNAGEKHPLWKGKEVGYGSLHRWVSRWKGNPKKCELCGSEKKKQYEWVNIDHKYKRVLEDYIRMCTSCHRIYDIKNNNYIPFGGKKKYAPPKLQELQVLEILRKFKIIGYKKGDYTYYARKFNVSRTHISNIHKNKTHWNKE